MNIVEMAYFSPKIPEKLLGDILEQILINFGEFNISEEVDEKDGDDSSLFSKLQSYRKS